MKADKIIVYRDHGGLWRWKIVAANNQTIASSGEGFTRKWSAWRAARRVMRGNGK